MGFHCIIMPNLIEYSNYVSEEVGHASSNITKTSHAPTCNVLNKRQLASRINIDRAVIYLAKDAILSKP